MGIKYVEFDFVLDYEGLAYALRVWRKNHEFTQIEVGELIGHSAWPVSYIERGCPGHENRGLRENGRISLHMFLDICNLIGVDPRQFFVLENTE